MYNEYYDYGRNIEKQIDEAAEHEEHNRRRPRATKHATEAFYNFKRKKKGKKKNG